MTAEAPRCACGADSAVYLRLPHSLPRWVCRIHFTEAIYALREGTSRVVVTNGDDMDYGMRLLMARSREAFSNGGTCACGAKGVTLVNAERWECLPCFTAAARPEPRSGSSPTSGARPS
jgi:hypothetical protein